MPTIVDEMRAAGFDDATIGSWANEQKPAMREAGFDDATIEGYFSGLKSPGTIPRPFLKRFLSSTSISDAAVEGAKAGFGDQPLGPTPEDKAKLRASGIYNDYDAPGGPQGGPVKYLRMANETVIDGAVTAVGAMFRGVNAGLMGAGAVGGQLVSELSGQGEADQAKARRDWAHMVTFGAMLAGTVSPVTKPGNVVNKMPNDTTLGHLPVAEDFTAAAKIAADAHRTAQDVLSEPATPPVAPPPIAPAAPETVRFYHGGDEPGTGGGRWVTPDPVYARDFRRGDGAPNNVHHVDIPKDRLLSDLSAGYDEINGLPRSFEAPEEFAKQLTPSGVIADKPAPTLFDHVPAQAREKIVQLYEDHGIHPAEVAADVKSDPEIARAIMSDDPKELPAAYVREPKPEPTPPTPGLSAEHAEVEARVAKKIADDYPAARAEYEALPDSNGGKVLNTDTARELSPDYAKDKKSRSLLSQAVHEPVSAFIKKLYAEKLTELPPDSTVLFTSGGAGAGKSRAIQDVPSISKIADDAALVYDTNMNTLAGATSKIDQALAAGAKVEVIHVQRDPVTALTHGALPRAAKVGRTVPLEHHIGTHVGAAETIVQLVEKYQDNPNVVIHIVDNTGEMGAAKASDLAIVHETDYTKLEERLLAALKDLHDRDQITDEVYRGTLGARYQGREPGGVSPRLSEGDGSGAGPVGSGGKEERLPAEGLGAREENSRFQEEVTAAVNAAFDAGEALTGTKPVQQYSPDKVTAPAGPLQPAGHFMFPADSLNVDAQRLQFKSDGDTQGVNKALAGVTQWDTSKAGGIIVWQQKDGQLFIADGHQRTGLARRLMSQGHEPIEIPGVLYREVDGVSSGDAMEIAASANIASGSGSALDGAKVLRNNPTLINGSLPLSTGKGKQAVALAKLNDEAFGMIVNEVVPENYGAVVGELIAKGDPRQVAAMKAIARFEPRNVDEAAALVNRVKAAEMAKADQGAQGSMFGDLETAESTAGEEMKIVGRAIADLKKDKTLFGRVVANAERIEQTGSKIEQEKAKSVATDAEKFARILASDAYSAGPIRDVLVAAAKDLKNGHVTLGDSANRVVAALRGETENAVADRDGAGGKPGPTAEGRGDGAANPEPAPGTYHKPIEEAGTGFETGPVEESGTASTADTGVKTGELNKIVSEFNSAQADMMQGDHPVSNIFQPPKRGEIVRLADKVKVYQKDHGWMTPAEAKAKIAQWKEHAQAQGDTSVNHNKVVLSFFDLTGEWSKPWEEAGYQVHRFDIQRDLEVGDVNNFSTEFFGDWFGDFEGHDIHAILAACPCTDFAVSGARHFAAKDLDGRTVASVKLVHKTLEAIEYFKPAVWALENPVGRIEKLGGLPPWRLSFDPHHLGDPYTKKTLLWGRFNGDLPIAPVEATEGSKMHSQYGGKSQATKNARSVTPEGFSYGFFMANNAVDHPAMAIANKYDRLDRGSIERAVDAGVTERQISDVVDDHYYMELDDDAANKAIRDLIPAGSERTTSRTEPGADGKPQGLIPGVEPIAPAKPLTVKEQLIEAAGRPMTGGDKPADGLFGNSMNEPQLFDAKPRTIFEQAEDRARGQDILDGAEGGAPQGLSAAATADPYTIAPTRILPPGTLASAARDAAARVAGIWRDIQMNTAPMVLGSKAAMATLKDFANVMRRIRYDWSKADDAIVKAFPDRESRARMWSASDEESVAIQLGESREHQGLVTLTPDERAMVEQLQTRMQSTWVQARDVGMVEGEGLPSYTPRMLTNVATAEGRTPQALNAIGGNVATTSARLRRRAHMMDYETEAAGKTRFGEDVELARDIRSYPLAVASLEKAIAGRQLINDIKEIGKRAGTETVAEGGKPPGGQWFTIDHPAFKTWRPRLERDAEGKWQTVKDAEGEIVFDQVPIHVHRDFEGPIRAVLDQRSGEFYKAAMEIKGKTMSVIMNSPLIHNFVEYGRAFASMPGRMITFRVYRDGKAMLADPALMREAIDHGMVPIGNRAFNQDITSIMEAPELQAGRSLTANALAETFGNLPQKGMTRAEVKQSVREGVDKAGNFWHNTLLWDQVAKLQAGLYTNIKADLMAKGVDQVTAQYMAAHMSNRYAGAIPKEAMGHGATVIANSLLFSRSFTMGNLGVIKDMLNGLPRDVMAQIERDVGAVNPKAVDYARKIARNKAIAIVVTDIVLFHVINSLLQSTINVISGRKDTEQELQGYADRMSKQFEHVKETPAALLHPLAIMEGISSTSENEPTKRGHVYVGNTKDGTAFYLRNTIGKLGEEFESWGLSPLEMLRKKEGTIFRPLMQVFANDKGFGRKIYDPHIENSYGDMVKNMAAIGAHIAMAQAPQGQVSAAYDLATGQGDKTLNALQAFGPILGTTFSRGAPGGPAVGEMYAWHDKHKFMVDAKLPGWRRQIQNGDAAGAVTDMTQMGVPKGLVQFYVRTSLYPATRLTARAMKDFYIGATPEERSRMEDTLRRQPPGAQ